ncbi:MAG TPA: hypothetical protein VG518_03290 [Solirubrobacterales bacterium]|nr:hypothetical protein [Solirubrobacterales bacterium]
MRKLLLRIAIVAGALLVAVGAAATDAALVKVGKLVLRADGSFLPSILPKQAYSPITLKGHVNVSSVDHGVPPAVTDVELDFGHNGKLQTLGLPTCPPEKLAGTTPGQARKRCKGAIVATGNVEALVQRPGEPRVPIRTPVTVFNGPPEGGNPTVVFHTYTWFPESETFVVSAPVKRERKGPIAFHVDIAIPPIAGGYGAITHGDIRIGRRYTYKGREMAYTSAHCPDGLLEAHGRVTFDNGVVIEGTIFKPCSADPPRP